MLSNLRHLPAFAQLTPSAFPCHSHESYEDINQRLHGKFAAAAFRLWLEAGQDVEECCRKIALSCLDKLAISFRSCTALTDDTCRLLAAHLPSTLEDVRPRHRLTIASRTSRHAYSLKAFACYAAARLMRHHRCVSKSPARERAMWAGALFSMESLSA